MEEGLYFKDRVEAGNLLGEKLADLKDEKNVIVLAIPRGGVIIADQVAAALNITLGLIVVRKIGHPLNPEFAMGAVTDNGHLVGTVGDLQGVDAKWLKEEIDRQINEAKRRKELYLNNKILDVLGKTVILIDDGIATGMSMLAAIKEVQDRKASKIIVAVPVAAKDTAEKISSYVDEFRSVEIPEYFLGAIGAYYDNFPQVTDQEVIEIMKKYD